MLLLLVLIIFFTRFMEKLEGSILGTLVLDMLGSADG
jgi:hypothetical protein